MDTSIFLLKFWGWYCLIFFFILSFNPKRIKQIIDDLQDQKFTILISFIAIVIGLLNVLSHNIWESNLATLLVTLFGWMALIKGVLLFAFPRLIVKWVTLFNIKFVQVLYVLLFFIGLFLLNEAHGIILY